MRFLADENFPLPSIISLRQVGYEVISIAEESSGIEDTEVLARAASEKLVILTFDRDNGELIYRRELSPAWGIIYFRYQPRTPYEPAEQLLQLLSQTDISFERKFTVLEREQLRQRPLK
jgi:predicted nuclease of predicted toxin-antitoxin system